MNADRTPTDRDALEELAKHSRLDVVHKVIHYLYMPTEADAEKIMVALTAQNFVVEEETYLNFGEWSVRVQTEIVPSEDTILTLRSTLTELAKHYGGEYDGWAAEIPERP